MLSEKLSQTRDFLKDNTGIAHVISQIAALTENHGLRLDEISPGQESCEAHCRTTALKLRMFGTFPQLHRLIINIAEKLQFVRIGSLAINNKNDSENGICQIAVDMDVFAPK